MTINAKKAQDLIKQLQENTKRVSPRGQGRTKQETEPWIAHRIISAMATSDLLEYPIELIFSDRPDLILKQPNIQIGIEIIELIPPAYAHAVAIRNEHYSGALVDRSLFGWGATFTSQQIHEYFQGNPNRLTGNGWEGDGVELEWAKAVKKAVEHKVEKLNSSGFNVFPSNWLALYASSPGPELDHELGASLVVFPLERAGLYSFERLLVLSGKNLIVFESSGNRILKVPL